MRNQRSLQLPTANCEIYAECLLLTGKNLQMVRGMRGQAVPPQLTVQQPGDITLNVKYGKGKDNCKHYSIRNGLDLDKLVFSLR